MNIPPRKPEFGALAVIKDGDTVLLTKREDFEVWCLPGGGIDSGESAAEAVIREVKEELGLDVAVVRAVGFYSRPLESKHNIVFEVQIVGGTITPNAHEVIDTQYFNYESLPEDLISFFRQPIKDAFESPEHFRCWRQITPTPFENKTYQEVYALRDQSGLSRKEFYMKYFGNESDYQDIREF